MALIGAWNVAEASQAPRARTLQCTGTEVGFNMWKYERPIGRVYTLAFRGRSGKWYDWGNRPAAPVAEVDRRSADVAGHRPSATNIANEKDDLFIDTLVIRNGLRARNIADQIAKHEAPFEQKEVDRDPGRWNVPWRELVEVNRTHIVLMSAEGGAAPRREVNTINRASLEWRYSSNTVDTGSDVKGGKCTEVPLLMPPVPPFAKQAGMK
jgi:hypothetical protein